MAQLASLHLSLDAFVPASFLSGLAVAQTDEELREAEWLPLVILGFDHDEGGFALLRRV